MVRFCSEKWHYFFTVSWIFYNFDKNTRSGNWGAFKLKYVYTHADDYVKKLYETINIECPSQLCADTITRRLGMSTVYLPVEATRVGKVIYLDERLPQTIQWQQFGHELCHVLWHQDNQLHLAQSFIDLQENQANNFAYYACIPTPMLMGMELPETFGEAVHRVSTTFKVTPEFASKRLEFHLSKMYQSTS